MSRSVLYGSTSSTAGTSTESTASNAFTVSSQKDKNPNIVKPLNASNLDSLSKSSMPSNAYMDYTLNSENIASIRQRLLDTIGLGDAGLHRTFSKYINYYNRFKLPTLDDAFQKGYAHIFFVRPDCNLLNDNNTGNQLNDKFGVDMEFDYAWKNNPELVKQLVSNNGQNHDFMMLLSNKASSFSPNDEYINTENYGKTFKGWQISYGRNNVESKTAGDFSITYNDDRSFHVYLLHRLWVDYISEVYQGRKAPLIQNIKNRILDYASSCYYLITAEDGETIIFWSKYYGVFPTTIPSTQFAWAQGTTIEPPKLDIKYQYSFKEDMRPESLVEFNNNAGVHKNPNMTYVPTYDSKLGHSGTTWVRTPYIELVTNNSDPECPYTFKLRFSQS